MPDDRRIDPTTIARLFHTVSFPDPDNTRITKKTLELVSEYIRLFMDEAIVRADEYRVEEKKRLTDSYETGEGVGLVEGGGVLDVKHLEAIAGLLVLDF
ncbi:DEKNAAC105116 [Brettanomyces naardenensis]|uniref:DEKNAAC105116 n=1 Tax=Brettanomyces naardenensis TaxID=13370 RepID=A0A448YSQ3_BRENA|nr:DEKNAAC105116 [Brettanomyces naardenensis]